MTETTLFILRFSLFAVVHSLLALPAIKVKCTGRSSHLIRFYRLYYNIVSLLLFGWVMAAFKSSAILFVVPGVWSLVLYFMQLVFLVILFACVRQTGMAEFLGVSAVPVNERKAPRLVTDGWYRIVRHPLYLFSMLFLLSNPVISSRGLLLTLFSAIYFFIGARLEEHRLLLAFGSEYETYQRTVPFIFPRIFT
ncbi:MAG: isoprenylcysteine carboxylmethyltransferase family protein [Desulfuromonadaceae bacterium]|nr:isoprenylcysteine carboxylmethyltransferase family protein [Desulfuromonadaceae bacterium]MDD2848259.1 isoprenylcysteine carboxylmethyltransferase family protein [Desulfuromonadaceae bacterium]MDD4130574.1 isoprenylcysteine carboxylmethyltransferase family protein [Desulfuromonadaceae bacterium]